MADDEEGQGGSTEDARIEVLQQYTLKTMKQKSDKWTKVNFYPFVHYFTSHNILPFIYSCIYLSTYQSVV